MQPFSQGQHEFLASLLNVVIVKLRYDEDTEWSDDQDEPEEEALFFEMRKVRLGMAEVNHASVRACVCVC